MMSWVSVKNGEIPAGALVAGYEADGTPLYVARTEHEGGLYPGKASKALGAIHINYEGKEVTKHDYEVLCCNARELSWVAVLPLSFYSALIDSGAALNVCMHPAGPLGEAREGPTAAGAGVVFRKGEGWPVTVRRSRQVQGRTSRGQSRCVAILSSSPTGETFTAMAGWQIRAQATI